MTLWLQNDIRCNGHVSEPRASISLCCQTAKRRLGSRTIQKVGGIIMLFCISGNYTPQALQAMLDNPDTNRREAFEQFIVSAGGKLVSMFGTIAEGPGALAIIDVDPMVAPALMGIMTSTGTLHNVKLQRVLSPEEIAGVRQKGRELRASYKAPGQ